MTETKKTRQPLPAKHVSEAKPPAAGWYRWLPDGPKGQKWLRISVRASNGSITTKDYEVQRVPGGYNLYYIDNTGNVRVYAIDTAWPNSVWSCNCEDALYRPERRHACKHVRALRKALDDLLNKTPF